MKQEDIYRCPDCKDGKKCMKHHQYKTEDYVIVPPDNKQEKIMALEKENKILLEALWHCGLQQKVTTAEAGVRGLVPARVSNEIDFTKFDLLNNSDFKPAKSRF